MPAGIRHSLFAICALLMTVQLAHAQKHTFADLLERARAQAAAGHRWEPPGDNVTETVMSMMDLIPTATPAQLAQLSALLETEKKNADHAAPDSGAPTDQGTSAVASTADLQPPPPDNTTPTSAPSAADASEEASAALHDDSGPAKPASDAPGSALPDAAKPDPATVQPAPDREVASREVPGALTNGSAPPSAVTPGPLTPSPLAPAPEAPSPQAPAPEASGVTAPAPAAPGSTGPGSVATSHTEPGSVGPSSDTPASVQPRPLPPNPIKPDEARRAAMLFARGLEAEHLGDVSGARRYYAAAAEKGDAAAAHNLGRLYDPAFLRKTALGGVDPDPALARLWYQRAIRLGDTTADPLLEALATR